MSASAKSKLPPNEEQESQRQLQYLSQRGRLSSDDQHRSVRLARCHFAAQDEPTVRVFPWQVLFPWYQHKRLDKKKTNPINRSRGLSAKARPGEMMWAQVLSQEAISYLVDALPSFRFRQGFRVDPL